MWGKQREVSQQFSDHACTLLDFLLHEPKYKQLPFDEGREQNLTDFPALRIQYSTARCPTTWRSYRDHRSPWRRTSLCPDAHSSAVGVAEPADDCRQVRGRTDGTGGRVSCWVACWLADHFVDVVRPFRRDVCVHRRPSGAAVAGCTGRKSRPATAFADECISRRSTLPLARTCTCPYTSALSTPSNSTRPVSPHRLLRGSRAPPSTCRTCRRRVAGRSATSRQQVTDLSPTRLATSLASCGGGNWSRWIWPLSPPAVDEARDRVISCVCDCVCVCVSAFSKENGFNYQHQSWYRCGP